MQHTLEAQLEEVKARLPKNDEDAPHCVIRLTCPFSTTVSELVAHTGHSVIVVFGDLRVLPDLR